MVRIEIRLFATFRIGRGKKTQVELTDPTPMKALEAVGIMPHEVAILLVNGQDGRLNQTLYEGDYLSVFPPVGGG